MNVYIGKKQTVLSNIFKPIAKETQISRSAAVVYDVMFYYLITILINTGLDLYMVICNN